MPPSDPTNHAVRGPAHWERWLLVGVWAAGALLGWTFLYRGWIPHDAGAMGHAAERVLAGELPHRDFVDVYTGGQALLNALVFRFFGIGVTTMRLVFFAAFLAWIPAVWYVARRLVGPWLAAAATLLAAALTLPVYAEGMPSWYNLFLATAGAAALLRYLERRRSWWLVLAGAAGGLSILFKVVGLYYVAAALLFVLYLETLEEPDGARGSDRAYRVAALAACTVMALLASYVVTTGSDATGLLHFLVPPLAAVGVVAARLRRESGRGSAERFRTLVRLAAPVVAGVVAPVALFLLPYAASGSVAAVYEGVFVLPRLRLDFASRASLPVLGFLPALALVAWVSAGRAFVTPRDRLVGLVGGGAVVALVALSHIDLVYRVVWWTLTSLGPIVAVVGAGIAVRRTSPTPDPTRRHALPLLLGVFGFCNLVQIPFAAPIYFLYAAPLLLLLCLALVAGAPRARQAWLLFVVLVLVGFSGLRLDTGFLYHLGFRYRPHRQTEALTLERARGIRVTPEEKGEFEELVRLVRSLDTGPTILVMPDAPEIYFLTGLENPTRTLFDFFEDGDGRAEEILSLVDETGLEVVVLNRRQLFSAPIEGPLLDSLEARFGWSAEVGRFRILWKGPETAAGDTGIGQPASPGSDPR